MAEDELVEADPQERSVCARKYPRAAGEASVLDMRLVVEAGGAQAVVAAPAVFIRIGPPVRE